MAVYGGDGRGIRVSPRLPWRVHMTAGSPPSATDLGRRRRPADHGRRRRPPAPRRGRRRPHTPPTRSAGKRLLRRVGAVLVGGGALGGLLLWLAAQLVAPPINEAGLRGEQRVAALLVGEYRPIELKPLCATQGGIVAPPAEKDAAYHWRCQRSSGPITPQQIAERCAAQWGKEAELVLTDPDSSSGWKCHLGGLISKTGAYKQDHSHAWVPSSSGKDARWVASGMVV
jgi:hypothetical protein